MFIKHSKVPRKINNKAKTSKDQEEQTDIAKDRQVERTGEVRTWTEQLKLDYSQYIQNSLSVLTAWHVFNTVVHIAWVCLNRLYELSQVCMISVQVICLLSVWEAWWCSLLPQNIKIIHINKQSYLKSKSYQRRFKKTDTLQIYCIIIKSVCFCIIVFVTGFWNIWWLLWLYTAYLQKRFK